MHTSSQPFHYQMDSGSGYSPEELGIKEYIAKESKKHESASYQLKGDYTAKILADPVQSFVEHMQRYNTIDKEKSRYGLDLPSLVQSYGKPDMRYH